MEDTAAPPDALLSPAAILQMGTGFWASKTLISAVELGIFTELAAAPLDVAELSRRVGLHPRGALDFLDALVALGMLERNHGLYANTAATAHFLDRNLPSYIGGILEMAEQRLYRFWGGLTTALRTGQPQSEVAGATDAFAELYRDPQRLRGFLQAMTGISQGSAQAIAAQFPWAEFKTFADIGTAQGGCATEVSLVHPHLAGVGFDLPVVQSLFEEYARSRGVAQRLRFQPGDFWNDPLPDVEVLIMGHVLHDWDLEGKRRLVAKAFAALPPGGALVVFDAMIDDERRRNAFGLLMSLNMLIETPGGFDYTGADCCAWLQQAGFRQVRVVGLGGGADSMAVGIKPA